MQQRSVRLAHDKTQAGHRIRNVCKISLLPSAVAKKCSSSFASFQRP
jgi:hypothetical protein